jgi:hypothetical protein
MRFCNWVRDGTFAKAGVINLTSHGRLIWKSVIHEFPRQEWSCELSEIDSVEIVPKSLEREGAHPASGAWRDQCLVVGKGGKQWLLIPASLKILIDEALEKPDSSQALTMGGGGRAAREDEHRSQTSGGSVGAFSSHFLLGAVIGLVPVAAIIWSVQARNGPELLMLLALPFLVPDLVFWYFGVRSLVRKLRFKS